MTKSTAQECFGAAAAIGGRTCRWVGLALFLATVAVSAETTTQDLKLWYPRPATKWIEALPVGNGRLGAMIFGGVANERLQLNEKGVWSGSPQEADNPASLPAVPKVRELLFQGKYSEAEALAVKTLVSAGPGSSGGNGSRGPYGCYQTLGDLNLTFADQKETEAKNYRRELDLDKALAKVSYDIGGATFTRTVFASHPDQVLVVRFTCSQPGRISFDAALTRSEMAVTTGLGPNQLLMQGQMFDGKATNGVRFSARLSAYATGGSVGATNNILKVEKADSVTLLLAAATDYQLKPPSFRGGDAGATTREQTAKAAAKVYPKLLVDHVRDYQSLFERVSLTIEGDSGAARPTDERLVSFHKGRADSGLIPLYFQYGRYLLISSSRPGDLPANLQGLWADGIQTPWNCDYHTDINVQMNYWMAEAANLSECHLPLIDFIDALRPSGRKTAKVVHGAGGWTAHAITNPWGFTSPGEHPGWGFFPAGGAWLCRHVWEHYAFTKDKAYLAKYWPIMKESAEFYLDWLVKDPKTGKLVSGPASSPENVFIAPGGQRGQLSMGPAMEQEIIWDLFENTRAAAAELGLADVFTARVAKAQSELLGPQVGSDGRLLEWASQFGEAEPHHRHVSHLYALHPGSQITANTPELFAAARKSLEGRGDGGTGWSMAWKINFWARLKEGDHAETLVKNLLNPVETLGTQMDGGGGTYPNLFCAHPPFQMDGNFGGASGIAEMLIQSHAGMIDLLPALPSDWKSGQASGLRARGGFEVSMVWKDGALRSVKIKATQTGPCKIRFKTPLEPATEGLGPLERAGENTVQFAAAADKTYEFRPKP